MNAQIRTLLTLLVCIAQCLAVPSISYGATQKGNRARRGGSRTELTSFSAQLKNYYALFKDLESIELKGPQVIDQLLAAEFIDFKNAEEGIEKTEHSLEPSIIVTHEVVHEAALDVLRTLEGTRSLGEAVHELEKIMIDYYAYHGQDVDINKVLAIDYLLKLSENTVFSQEFKAHRAEMDTYWGHVLQTLKITGIVTAVGAFLYPGQMANKLKSQVSTVGTRLGNKLRVYRQNTKPAPKASGSKDQPLIASYPSSATYPGPIPRDMSLARVYKYKQANKYGLKKLSAGMVNWLTTKKSFSQRLKDSLLFGVGVGGFGGAAVGAIKFKLYQNDMDPLAGYTGATPGEILNSEYYGLSALSLNCSVKSLLTDVENLEANRENSTKIQERIDETLEYAAHFNLLWRSAPLYQSEQALPASVGIDSRSGAIYHNGEFVFECPHLKEKEPADGLEVSLESVRKDLTAAKEILYRNKADADATEFYTTHLLGSLYKSFYADQREIEAFNSEQLAKRIARQEKAAAEAAEKAAEAAKLEVERQALEIKDPSEVEAFLLANKKQPADEIPLHKAQLNFVEVADLFLNEDSAISKKMRSLDAAAPESLDIIEVETPRGRVNEVAGIRLEKNALADFYLDYIESKTKTSSEEIASKMLNELPISSFNRVVLLLMADFMESETHRPVIVRLLHHIHLALAKQPGYSVPANVNPTPLFLSLVYKRDVFYALASKPETSIDTAKEDLLKNYQSAQSSYRQPWLQSGVSQFMLKALVESTGISSYYADTLQKMLPKLSDLSNRVYKPSDELYEILDGAMTTEMIPTVRASRIDGIQFLSLMAPISLMKSVCDIRGAIALRGAKDRASLNASFQESNGREQAATDLNDFLDNEMTPFLVELEAKTKRLLDLQLATIEMTSGLTYGGQPIGTSDQIAFWCESTDTRYGGEGIAETAGNLVENIIKGEIYVLTDRLQALNTLDTDLPEDPNALTLPADSSEIDMLIPGEDQDDQGDLGLPPIGEPGSDQE